MDPTAPDDNSQNPQNGQNAQNNPVQPGQFVVSGETGVPTPDVSPQSPNLDPQAQIDNTLQQTAPPAPGPIGPQLAGESPPAMQNLGVSPQFAASPPPPPGPVNMQPDPTPFTPPTMPGSQQVQNQSSGDSSSKMAKSKIVAIICAVLVLIAIIAAVVWFFVLNKKSSEQVNVVQTTNQVEEPALPSPQTGSGFGDIPPSSPEATTGAQDQLPTQP